MPVDDMPQPEEQVSPDVAYQLGYDDASDQPLATGVPSNVATWATAVRGTIAPPVPRR